MSAALGTPKFFDKVRVAVGALFGRRPATAEDMKTLIGDEKDLNKAVNALEDMFGTVIHQFETDDLADLANFLQDVLANTDSITSVSQAIKVVEDAAAGQVGTAQAQLLSLSKMALVTLVTAALTSIGKINLPLQ